MKKLASLICVFTLMLTLVSCGQSEMESSSASADAATTTVYGQVQSIDGQNVTLLLGTAQIATMSGAAPGNGGSKPSGKPDSSAANRSTESPADSGGSSPDNSSGKKKNLPKGRFGGTSYTFTAGEEIERYVIPKSLSIQLSDGSSGTSSDLAKKDVIQLTLDANKGVTAVTQLRIHAGAGPTHSRSKAPKSRSDAVHSSADAAASGDASANK